MEEVIRLWNASGLVDFLGHRPHGYMGHRKQASEEFIQRSLTLSQIVSMYYAAV